MQRIVRTAGSAAVAVVLAATASFAGPSFATEAQPLPAISYAAHAAAVTDPVVEQAIDAAQQQAQPAATPQTPSPVAEHAVANVEPAPAPEAVPAPAPTPAPVFRPERDGRSLAQLVREYSDDALTNEIDCLARAVYFESNGEPLAGRLAVAEVIINRSRSGRFPTSVCGVVRQRGQFSFVRGGHIPAPPRNAGWREAIGIAHVAVHDLADSSASSALFFHARRVSPGWRNLRRVATVGNHVFYR